MPYHIDYIKYLPTKFLWKGLKTERKKGNSGQSCPICKWCLELECSTSVMSPQQGEHFNHKSLSSHTSALLQHRALRTSTELGRTDQPSEPIRARIRTQGRRLSNAPTTVSIPYLTQRRRLVRASIPPFRAGGILQNKETSNCALWLSPAHSSQLTWSCRH